MGHKSGSGSSVRLIKTAINPYIRAGDADGDQISTRHGGIWSFIIFYKIIVIFIIKLETYILGEVCPFMNIHPVDAMQPARQHTAAHTQKDYMEKFTVLKRAIDISMPVHKVWPILADFGNICHGHPAVRKSRVTSVQTSGVGATRHCDFTMMGGSAEERVTEWVEGQTVTVEVYELHKMPGLKTVKLRLDIVPNGNATVLTGTMTYSMQNAFFDLVNTLVMKSMNTKLLNGILAGHKMYIETGELVTDKTPLDLSLAIPA